MKNPSYYMCLIYYLLLRIYSTYKTCLFSLLVNTRTIWDFKLEKNMCCCELLVAELLVSTRSPRYITELYNPNKYSSRSVSNTDANQADDVSEAKKTQESNFLCIISSHLWLPPAKITRHTESFMQVQHERWTCASGCAGRLISCTATVTKSVSGALGLKTQPEVWGRNKPHTKMTQEEEIWEAWKNICVQKYQTQQDSSV